MKPPYAVRKILGRDELSYFRGDKKVMMARERELLLRKLEQEINIYEYVIMFREEVVRDTYSPHYGDTQVFALAYPKDSFNGGVFQ